MSSLPQEHWDYELGRVYSATEFERLVEYRIDQRMKLRRARLRMWRKMRPLIVLVAILFAILIGLKLNNFLKERELSRLTSYTNRLSNDLSEQSFYALGLERKLLFAPRVAQELGLSQNVRHRIRLTSQPVELSNLDLVELVYPGMSHRNRH